ncbi:MAG: NAD(P)-dependent oxidoreductase [Candidatus Latescibacterota bacterium]|nr:NAD(P)-dependent oxidoreductase [Candidatus Latescibacterota bacterium]
MRVLLTGAAGFVGRVALDLLRENHEVTAFDVRPVEGYEGAVEGDVLDYKTVAAAVAGHDAVVNTIMAPNPSYGGDGPGFTINVTGVYNLLEAARVHSVERFVHTSSGAVHTGYPGPPETFLTHDLYPLKANGPYALSKLLQEELARNFHGQHGLSIACVRPWGIIDAERMVTTDGHAVTGHSWGHIDRRDVASALVCALGTDSIEYECFYVMATPGGYKAVDVARTEKRLGWKPAITFDADL